VSTIRESRYKPAAFHVEWVRVDQPVPMAPWRAVGATQNGFFLECFIDEVARAPGAIRTSCAANCWRTIRGR